MPDDDRFVTQVAVAFERSRHLDDADPAPADERADDGLEGRAVLVAAGSALGDPQFLPPIPASRDRERRAP